MNFETQESVSTSSYLKMIKYKTGVLLACVKTGALVAEAAEDQKHLHDLAFISVCLQLMDDILDVYGTERI